MPQTVEALNLAQAASVPVVVAVNKVDKPDAKPAKVRQQLTEYGLVAEEYGGDVMFVDVSARAGATIQALLDAVLPPAAEGDQESVVSGKRVQVRVNTEVPRTTKQHT